MLTATASAPATLDLNGAWSLAQEGGGATAPISLPGDVHSALLAAGLIPDPYHAENENLVQWVSAADWRLSRTVEVSATMLAAPSIVLDAEILDTVCEIRINGTLAARTDNMQRRHLIEVRPLLTVGANRIELLFRSAEVEVAARAAKLPYPIPDSSNNLKRHFNLLRKAQCHAGWDWGICLVPCGSYGALRLRAVHTARIDHVVTRQEWQGDAVTVHITAMIDAPAAGTTTLTATIDGRTSSVPVAFAAGASQASVAVAVPSPRRWWPNGHGGQPLYELRVTCGDDVVVKRIGLRTLDVINEKDATGTSLAIRCNGRDIFAKGANWIPSDALPSRQGAAHEGLLRSAVAANMNMLRVWGGGHYESERFYELCDELGLMIWHDHMFACALYPSAKSFLAEIEAEVTYQTLRLRDHACLALWCGDNECIGALTWTETARKNRDRYIVDWDRLNRVRTDASEASDPTRLFWPSSPCAGPGDFSDTWHDDRHGDMHYWEVWHGSKPFEQYFKVTPRFCSEFGYQSFPSAEIVATYCPADQLNVTSPVMEHHQRNEGGNRRIIEMMTRYFRLPSGFEQFLYLSQVQQAIAIKTAVEHWRRLRPVCMGTLFWQLNDNWPVASWSSLEYGGRWKQLHHHARRFFAPVLLGLHPAKDDSALECWVTSDLADAGDGELVIETWGFDGTLVARVRSDVALPANAAACVASMPPAPAGTFVTARLAATVAGAPVTATNLFNPAPWKRCAMAAATVKLAIDGWKVTVSTDAPAFFVTVTAPGIAGEFDDNSLHLLPGRPVTLTFAPGAGSTPESLVKALAVMHLRETY